MAKKRKFLKWKMMGGNETWVRLGTKKNMDIIYKFLEEKTLEAKKNGKRQPSFTYSEICRQTGLSPHCARFAVQKLAFVIDPYVTIRLTTFRSKRGVQCGERVKLIRFIEKKASKSEVSNSDGK